jgi:hypothetical protein
MQAVASAGSLYVQKSMSLVLCIREVPGASLFPQPGYHVGSTGGVSRFLQVNYVTVAT